MTLPVAAIVVNHDAGTHLVRCLASLRAAGVAERIVVDNASSDGSRRMAEAADDGMTWIDSGGNLGYGRAANLGSESTGSPFLLVCNPDLRVEPDAVDCLVARLVAEPDLGAVGPLVRNPDGSVYPSARTFPDLLDAAGHGLLGMVAPNNRWSRRYQLLDWDHHRPARVDWVSGACMLLRRQAWDAVGGFDPRYFMYLEDVDLCWRLGRAGWGVGFEPAAEVVHVQGVSASRHPYRMLVAHHRSLWRFAVTTTTGPRRLALPLIAAGLVARVGVASLQHRLDGGHANRAVRAAPARRLP
jgi:N-acetylglucosaminyl-diphospho-decaprenol L-rhamnosyltransferase